MTNLHIPFENYSLLWTLNGLMIVIGQPFVNRIGSHFKLSTQTYTGVAIFAASFIWLIFARDYTAFVLVMIMTTIGEMMVFLEFLLGSTACRHPSSGVNFKGCTTCLCPVAGL